MTDQRCYVCGCSQQDCCQVFGVACCWIAVADASPLCSACAPLEELLAAPLGQRWLKDVIGAAERGGVRRCTPCAAMRRELRELAASQART